MKLFHRMMMLTLILCLVFGLGGCTQGELPVRTGAKLHADGGAPGRARDRTPDL